MKPRKQEIRGSSFGTRRDWTGHAGLLRLRMALDSPSWLVKVMAAQYLGEYGASEDYDLLVSRIGRETSNDFVVAEYCIAALKLFPKKQP